MKQLAARIDADWQTVINGELSLHEINNVLLPQLSFNLCAIDDLLQQARASRSDQGGASSVTASSAPSVTTSVSSTEATSLAGPVVTPAPKAHGAATAATSTTITPGGSVMPLSAQANADELRAFLRQHAPTTVRKSGRTACGV